LNIVTLYFFVTGNTFSEMLCLLLSSFNGIGGHEAEKSSSFY